MIELLVIVTISIVLSSLVLVDYGASVKLFSLERSMQDISQGIRKVQQKAMAGIKGSGDTNGYGFYFNTANKGSYIVYENNNTTPYYDSGDTILETIILPDDIEIESIKINELSQETLSISFCPPGPITYIHDKILNQNASITLKITDKEIKRTIIINSSGGSEIIKD